MLEHQCPVCKRLIPYGKRYCDECIQHVDEYRQSKRKSGPRKADPKYKAFYNSKEWRRMSRAILANAQWRCMDCGGIACEVHHIEPIQTESGWEKRFDFANVVALCTKCHNERHERFRQTRARGYMPR